MKGKKIILLISLALSSLCIHAQTSIETAKDLADRGEYLAAAQLYEKCADEVVDDVESYLMRLHDASECYYMLDDYRNVHRLALLYSVTLVSEKKHLDSFVVTNLNLRKGKILGSYYYGQTTNDPTDVNYQRAEKYYKSALDSLDIHDKSGFNEALYQDLAQLYYKWQRYQDALTYLEKVEQTSLIQSQEAMCYARLQNFSQALQLINKTLSETKGKEFYEMQRKKGKILMMQQDAKGIDNTQTAKGCYEQFVNYQINTVAKTLKAMTDSQREQYWLSMHDFLTDCYRLGNAAPELLYNLALYTKGYLLRYKDTQAKNVLWTDVQKILHPKEAAVEFLQYRGKDDRKRLGAVVLTSSTNSKPHFVDIVDVDSLLDSNISFLISYRTALESSDMNYKDALYNDEKLPTAIWNESLMDALKGAKTIYFSADGLLHQLAIEYLCPDSTITCKRLSSTRVLTEKQTAMNTSKMLLLGGIDYASPQTYVSDNNDDDCYQSLKHYASSIVYLSNTKSEVDSIVATRHSSQDILLSGLDASDQNFRTYSQQSPIIHVATHGYYIGKVSTGTDLKQQVSDNVMSKSGLIFSGAKYALSSDEHQAGYSDGILSAKELSKLSLAHTDLMVLSACQTAQGEVTADGVYGIQRALKMAGVKAMIVSLWSVNDRSTSLLMQYFYQNLQQTGDVHKAFNKARRQLMEISEPTFSSVSLGVKEEQTFNAPCYADAFILIDVI